MFTNFRGLLFIIAKQQLTNYLPSMNERTNHLLAGVSNGTYNLRYVVLTRLVVRVKNYHHKTSTANQSRPCYHVISCLASEVEIAIL